MTYWRVAAHLFLGAGDRGTREPQGHDCMKVLFLDQFNGLGGGQQCLRDLIPGIVDRGWTAHVGLPSGGPLAHDIARAGGIVHELQLQQYSNGRKTVEVT